MQFWLTKQCVPTGFHNYLNTGCSQIILNLLFKPCKIFGGQYVMCLIDSTSGGSMKLLCICRYCQISVNQFMKALTHLLGVIHRQKSHVEYGLHSYHIVTSHDLIVYRYCHYHNIYVAPFILEVANCIMRLSLN